MTKYEIHISDVNTYKQCRRLWDWTSPLRQNLEPDRPYAPFFLGSIIHDTLELYYGSSVPFEQARTHSVERQTALLHQHTEIWPVEEEMIQEQVELATGILEHYRLWINSKVTHQGQPWADDQFEFISIEHGFEVPLLTENGYASNRVYYAGRFDGIARHKETGNLWVWENKTARSIKRLTDTLWNNQQATAYVMAAQRLFPDETVEGIMYNILRKKVPASPAVLTNGMLSKAKRASITFDWYARAVQEHHLLEGSSNPMTKKQTLGYYRDYLNYLATEENDYFRRVMIRRNENQLQLFEEELHAVSLEMARDNTPAFAEPGLHCGWCRFQEPCYARDAGLDERLILDNEYRTRKDRVPPDEEIVSDG